MQACADQALHNIMYIDLLFMYVSQSNPGS